MKTIKVKHYSEIPSNYTGIVEYSNGDKHWYLNGNLHRTDGPAVENSDGTKYWYLNGTHYSKEQWELLTFVYRSTLYKILGGKYEI